MARVIKLAQPGYDVKTAGDENLIFHSSWPLLKTYQEGPLSIPDVNSQITLATHDLQFPPVFWYFANTPISAWQNSGVITTDTRSEFFGPVGGGTIRVDSGKIFYKPTSGTTGKSRLYYYLFALDLTKQYTAPIIKTGGGALGSSSRNVFKIAKPGKDVSSTNLQDFVLHSNARSPLIHSVNPGVANEGIAGGSFAFTVYHNLGYIPMFFIYSQNSDGSYSLVPSGSGGTSKVVVDKNSIRFQETVVGRVLSIVVLKDPFRAEYSVGVSV